MRQWLAYVTDVPGDGTCMYHAIGLPLKISGHVLRKLVTEYIIHNPDSLLHDQSIRNWILWDRNISVEKYVEKLKSGQWGGALEATILASILNIPIFVYSPKSGLCKRISESRPDKTILSINIKVPPYICVLYTGNHYMSLNAFVETV